MITMKSGGARAVADLAEGYLLATVEIAAPPERVFQALASKEICEWWVRPGVFDTREWTGDVRVGGRSRGSGMFKGRPYVLEGEFLEVDAPRRLAHTWHPGGAPGRVDHRLIRPGPARGGNAHHAPALGLHGARGVR